MSGTNQLPHFLSEAETFRRLNLDPRKGAKLRQSGTLAPDETIANGRVRLYRAERLTELAAAIKPSPLTTLEHSSRLPA